MKNLIPLLLVLCLPQLSAQQPDLGPAFAQIQPWVFTSGRQVNPSGERQIVFWHGIRVAGAPALRVFFSELDLGPRDWLEVRTTPDSEGQRLDRREAARWHNSSAFFNGDTLNLRLVLAPGSKASFTISHLLVGLPIYQTESICGSVDTRVPLQDGRVTRLLSSAGSAGCSGFLAGIDDCAVTAGHCVTASVTSTAEFNVPPSTSSGALQHPPLRDQFPIDGSTISFVDGGVGNDWAVFKLMLNNLGESAAARFGWFQMEAMTPVAGRVLRVSGFGSTSGVNNQVLLTGTGPAASAAFSGLHYQVDTSPGDSGSPIIDVLSGHVIGIHTHGGCSPFGGVNSGTGFANSGLQAALQALCSTTSLDFWMASSGAGVGDFSMFVDHLPSSTVQGYTLFSRNIAGPAGGGTVGGLYPDNLTLAILNLPGSSTDVLHWIAPFSGSFYPTSPLNLPPGSVPFMQGEVLDGVAVALGPGFSLLEISNVMRITF